MGMNAKQAVDYVTGIGIDVNVWKGCHECGPCNNKKIKCRNHSYELQLMYSKGRFNLFQSGKAIKGGMISDIKTALEGI